MTLDDLRDELARLPAFGHAMVKVEHDELGWCWTAAAVRHEGGVVFVQSGEAADGDRRVEYQAYVLQQRDRLQACERLLLALVDQLVTGHPPIPMTWLGDVHEAIVHRKTLPSPSASGARVRTVKPRRTAASRRTFDGRNTQ